MFENYTAQQQQDRLVSFTPQKKSAVKGDQWCHDADEMLGQLKRTPKQNWTGSISSMMILLRQAQNIITKFEQHIKTQDQHIADLQRLSTTDTLTGISNRRGFLQIFNRELDRVDRDKSQGGLLIMIDLDNFKTINDKYGHAAGDTALKVVSSTLANDIRTMDSVGRMGGDEFVILFVNTNRIDALERAQFLIKTLNNLSFIWQGEEVPIRASLGLKQYGKGSKAKHIFRTADARMYENKQENKRRDH